MVGLTLTLAAAGTPTAVAHLVDAAARRAAPGVVNPLGRELAPAGRITPVGNFPTGGALTPDGRQYWAVDSGHGHDDVKVVDVATGRVQQTLPLPGAYGGVAFAPDGRTAYVSGEPKGSTVPGDSAVAPAGDAVHVFRLAPGTGTATEQAPITLPKTQGGTAQRRAGDPAPFPGPGQSRALGWPEGLAVTPNGRTLAVALNQADEVVLVDLTTGTSRLVPVGAYPVDVKVTNDRAYVSNEYSGTISEVDLPTGKVVGTVGVGGALGNRNAHPQGLALDPARHRLFVAVANRDLIAQVNIDTDTVTSTVSVARGQNLGSQPVALALDPARDRLYAADAGEDAVAVLSVGAARPALAGRVPTAAYPTDAAITRGHQLVWLSAEGDGPGANPGYGSHWANSGAAPYGTYVPDKLIGQVGVLPAPGPAQLARDSAAADRAVVPANAEAAPAGTPLVGPDGGPSRQIKHVFYIVRENRTYDQVFGTDPRGDGDPKLELLDDNGVAGPAGGVTPNAHALARQFPLMDHVLADSQVSIDGHVITSSGYATNFVEKGLHPAYSGRGRVTGYGQYPESFPPRDFIFDQAARQRVPFINDGENSAGVRPESDDGRPTYPAVTAGTDTSWPGRFSCDFTPCQVPTSWNTDHGTIGAGGTDTTGSRFDYFQAQLNKEIAAGSVPAFNYLTLPNDHTNGTKPGFPTPKATIADNDYGLGQVVDLISHSPIWKDSAIFVVEDDTQDGGDHVDAHRMPAFAISPYARHGAVVHTRYDQESVLRTMELILGLKPLSLFDANATPMYDAFTDQADLTPYTALTPQQDLTELNKATAPDAKLSQAMPYGQVDAVPQEISDEVLWHSVYGMASTPPGPGPNASAAEHARAEHAMTAYRRGWARTPTGGEG